MEIANSFEALRKNPTCGSKVRCILNPVNLSPMYLFKVDNKNTRTMWQILSV